MQDKGNQKGVGKVQEQLLEASAYLGFDLLIIVLWHVSAEYPREGLRMWLFTSQDESIIDLWRTHLTLLVHTS